MEKEKLNSISKRGGVLEKKEKSSIIKNRNTKKPYTPRNLNKDSKPVRQTKKIEVKENIFKESPLKIIPLGGLLEIGKNMTVFEYENDIIIVDCGLAFPEDDMLGIDLVIPDVTYLLRNKDKIKGLVITHGHEDHIGGIPYFLKQINVPIYATRLTAGLITNKLEEHKLVNSTKLKVVTQGSKIRLGKFVVEFIQSCHSIPDSVMLAIKSPVGTVVHTGDFKIDYTPIDNQKMDLTKNEYTILYYLAKNKGKIVSRDEIMDYLWESEEFIDDNTLSVNVKRLRGKLKELGLIDRIETRRGQGYLLK